MRILHLSDLHLTAPFRSLEDIWSGPLPILEADGPFDFIVVSGDLSQRADPAEYERLGVFIKQHVMAHLVRPKEVARVIFVPGNHDVSWSADIGDSISIGRYLKGSTQGPGEGAGASSAEMMRRLQHQEDSGVRQAFDHAGVLEVLRIDWARYPSRFASVQKFFDDFYGDLPPGDRFHPFNLLSADAGDHWSAHVFKDSKVAFYGFNTCFRNDRYWHGAGLSSSAVLRARAHAEKHAPGMVRIAVWHHGLISDRDRPDRLTLQDLGLLHNANFHLGFHGHTHRAEVDLLDQFVAERFVVISTGSLGAGAAERPDAVGNQFSIVQVFPGQVDVKTLERDHLGIFREKSKRLLLLSNGAARPAQRSHAQKHTRTCLVDEQGIATVAVELKNAFVHGHITLAVVAPPFCNVAGDTEAETSEGRRPVVREALPDGRVRFTLAGTELMKSVHWSYRVSNSHALHQGDLQLMDRRSTSKLALREHEDCRTFTIYFPCDLFECTIAFAPKTSGIEQNSARCVVERWDAAGGQEQWRPIESERSRCSIESKTHLVRFSVEAPIVEHRYTVAYKLVRREEGELDADGADVAEHVALRCRSERAPWARLSAELSTSLDDALREVLEGEIGPRAECVGLLWSSSQKRLLTGFGKFSPERWKARFAAGAGLAGHAFRFATDAAWHRETLESGKQTSFAVIFQRARLHAGGHLTEYPYEWIVCIPILTPKRAAVGVVSFAGFENGTDTDRRLSTYARRVNEGKLRVRSDALRDNLITAVNAAFWTTIATSAEITDLEMRRYAKDFLLALSER